MSRREEDRIRIRRLESVDPWWGSGRYESLIRVFEWFGGVKLIVTLQPPALRCKSPERPSGDHPRPRIVEVSGAQRYLWSSLAPGNQREEARTDSEARGIKVASALSRQRYGPQFGPAHA